MGKITNKNLPDVQSNKDIFYERSIGKVGVGGVEIYLPIKMRDGSVQNTVAVVSSYCSLKKDVAGINMSRGAQTIYEVLHEDTTGDGFCDLEYFCKKLRENHNSDDVYCKAKFKLILNDEAPMSGKKTCEPVDVVIESIFKNNEYKTLLTVEYIGMSMCPCAKELASLKTNTTEEEWKFIESIEDEKLRWKIMNAGYASHSQKSKLKVTVEINKDQTNKLWIEDIIDMMKKSFSTPTTMLAKRCDEAYTVQTAYLGGYFDDDKNFVEVPYSGPKFVEDEIRYMAKFLDDELDQRIKDYVIVCVNYESLHSKDETAVAVLNANRELS